MTLAALTAFGLAAASCGLAAVPAHAVVPGYNGRLAFYSQRDGHNEIYLMHPDGTGQTRITTSTDFKNAPKWSPDGTKIAVTQNWGGATGEIIVMNADGSHVTNLTNNAVSDSSPAWSPDGTKIAFRSIRDGDWEIYTMNADGTNPTRLTTSPGIDDLPDWSPDGTKIAFTSYRTGTAQIFVMNSDGSNQTRLTNDSFSDSKPAWSPDGKRIAFQTNRDGNFEIYVMNADGSNQVRLTNNPATDQWPAWSPDGSEIAFHSDRGGEYGLYLVTPDGSTTQKISGLDNGFTDAQPDWESVANKPPVTANDTVSVQAGVTSSVDVLANDTDEEVLSVSNLTIKAAPTHGTATIKDGKVSYTPAKDYTGSDQLTYQICDSFLLDQKCSTGVLGISVTAAPATPTPTPSTTVSTPTVTSVGTVQLHGADKVYYTGHRPTFSGTATPGASIKVEIHSNPIILTTTADASGTWSVAPTEDIPNGEHQVMVTASKDGATSQALTLVLAINTGLAETGVPVWPLSVAGLAGLFDAREVLRRRAAKALPFAQV